MYIIKNLIQTIIEFPYRKRYLEDDLEETGVNSRITTGQVEGVVKSIDKKLAKNPMDKKLKKKAKEFKKDILPRKQKYEEAFAIFEGRNPSVPTG